MADDPLLPPAPGGDRDQSATPYAPAGDERTITTGAAHLKQVVAVAIQAGVVLDSRYQVEAVLGEGGSGTVYRAWDRVLGEPVAVKILHPSRAAEKSWIKRLAREVKVARAIRHPNVCRVFELGHADGHWFVTMELATGGNLRAQLRAEGGGETDDKTQDKTLRPLAERLVDAHALCAGLAAIHAVGIVHRDVTPQNVLRMADGRLVISDFGLAIESDDNTTVHGGTPAYMPPEAAMGGRSDLRSDVWQLGAILHELLFGGRPRWTREEGQVAMQWPLGSESSPVEEELARLCGECLAHDPEQRPSTAVAVVGRLAAAETARPRSWSARIWVRARGAYRRHRRLRLVLTAAIVALVATRAVQMIGQPSLCKGAADRVAGIWDLRSKALVRRAFVTTRRPYAVDAFWSVNRAIEKYLEAWIGMYTEACEATHARGEQSSEVLDLRMSCLQERLSGVKALSEIFVKADSEVVGNAVSAAGSLPQLDRCGNVKLLRSLVQPPDDPRLRARVELARQRLAEIKATRDAGRLKVAMSMAAALVAETQRIDYPPVQAEAQAIQGELETVAGDPRRAEEMLQQAFFVAEAAHDDDLKAETSTYLIEAVGYHQGRYQDAERWIRQSQATLHRIGGHERLQAWAENNAAILYHMQGRYPEAVAAYQRARQLAEGALPPDDPDIGRPLGNLAMALSAAGRPAEGLGYNERAVAILRRALGPGHPEVVMHMSNRGEILNALGRHAEARALFTSALASWAKELPADHPYIGDSLTGLGQSFLGEGTPEPALAPLERGLAIREKNHAEPAQIAETQFLLARALWGCGRDPARAQALARSARAGYGDKPWWRDKMGTIDHWLADHQQAAAPAGSARKPRAVARRP
ncbi:MAG TPA: serine/threonine-protein kinase [Polyangia bacterium]|jgi:tetratricopeptide (TPR) repeat protein|nr:serine/threonine-protein kinase [Polyangia bacterium]